MQISPWLDPYLSAWYTRSCRSSYMLCLGALVMLSMSSLRATELSAETNIEIRLSGDHGNAGQPLEAMLKDYLLRVLGKDALSGDGPTVVFDLQADAPSWQELPNLEQMTPRQLDRFKLDTRQPGRVLIHGPTARAVGYGITWFLEHELGVFWLFPGELGTHVQRRETVRLTPRLIEKQPALASRIYTGLSFREPTRLSLPTEGVVHNERMYFKGYDYQRSLRLNHLIYASHNMIRIFPVRESLAQHPEIFPIKDGKRHIPDPEGEGVGQGQAWHPCYSQPKTVEVALRHAREFFERREGLAFSLGINDGGRLQCQCQQCKATGWPQSYYRFVQQVAEGVRAQYPPFMISVLSYGDVGLPPEDLQLPENILVLGANTDAWAPHAHHLGTYEYLYGRGYWVPQFPLARLQANAQRYRDAGILALHAEVHPLWAFDGPKLYIRSNLLWDPDLDMNAALQRWCDAAFGPAASPMYDFYLAWSEIADPPQGDGFQQLTDLSHFRHSTHQMESLSPSLMTRTRHNLEQAKAQATTEVQKRRLAMVDVFYSYTETLWQLYQASRNVFTGESRPDIQALRKKRLDLLATMRDNPQWFAGSRVGVEEILGSEWEGRWEWSLDYEADSAARTLAFDQQQPTPETSSLPLTDFDAWRTYYHPDLYNPMDVTLETNGVSFTTNTTTQDRSVPPDSPHGIWNPNGLRKFWFRAKVPLTQGQETRISLEFQGGPGLIEAAVCNANDCGKKVYLEERLEGKRLSYDLVVKPVPTWGNDRPVNSWEVAVIFTPDSPESQISGRCEARQVLPSPDN